jgi:MOSC domain-containing protein
VPAASGVVLALWRYPVKSMRGERCERLALDRRGVEGDRLYAIRDAAGKFGSGKSTRRFRHVEGLLGFTAVYDGAVPVIGFPDGRRLRGDDAAIHEALSAALGQPVTLAREAGISHLDAGPVHLLTTASLAWLAERLPDARLDERRFRPNVLIGAPGAQPVEREWLGRTLAVGGKVRLAVREPTERCVMVDLAQSELPEDPRVLRTLAQAAGSDFGVYADVLKPGRIGIGDEIAVL